jgi:hypothetical protein
MAYDPNNQQRKDDLRCKDGGIKDLPTQITIGLERTPICNELYESASELSKQEKKVDGEHIVFNERKCLFKYTEENYRRYRNLDVVMGTEMITTNDAVRENLVRYKDWNKKLSEKLKGIAKGVKEAKGKFGDLKKAACDLDSCIKDSCNKTQRRALTGKGYGECPDQDVIDACRDSDKTLTELVCMPKALSLDIDSIFKAAHDVVGIQIFTNLDILDPLQKNLDTSAKDLKTYVSNVVKSRETDMKDLQAGLVKSIEDITKAAMGRNNARATFEGLYDATKYLCCPKCGCLKPNDDKPCDPRLKDSEKCICEICEDVKKAFCCNDKPTTRDHDHENH